MMKYDSSINVDNESNKSKVLVVASEFNLGDIVKHKIYQFRGVIVDIDPEFSNTDEWYESIPEDKRPKKDQPFYHLLAENSETFYSAYVSQQNLILDAESGPVNHPDIDHVFSDVFNGRYVLKSSSIN